RSTPLAEAGPREWPDRLLFDSLPHVTQVAKFAGQHLHRLHTRLQFPARSVGRRCARGVAHLSVLVNHQHPARRAVEPGVVVEMESLPIPLEILTPKGFG